MNIASFNLSMPLLKSQYSKSICPPLLIFSWQLGSRIDEYESSYNIFKFVLYPEDLSTQK